MAFACTFLPSGLTRAFQFRLDFEYRPFQNLDFSFFWINNAIVKCVFVYFGLYLAYSKGCNNHLIFGMFLHQKTWLYVWAAVVNFPRLLSSSRHFRPWCDWRLCLRTADWVVISPLLMRAVSLSVLRQMAEWKKRNSGWLHNARGLIPFAHVISVPCCFHVHTEQYAKHTAPWPSPSLSFLLPVISKPRRLSAHNVDVNNLAEDFFKNPLLNNRSRALNMHVWIIIQFHLLQSMQNLSRLLFVLWQYRREVTIQRRGFVFILAGFQSLLYFCTPPER